MDFRLYDGALGRFFGIDLLADLFTSHSPYHFAYNNPVSFADPSGLQPSPGIVHVDYDKVNNRTMLVTFYFFDGSIMMTEGFLASVIRDSEPQNTKQLGINPHEYGGDGPGGTPGSSGGGSRGGGGGGGSGNGNSRGASNGDSNRFSDDDIDTIQDYVSNYLTILEKFSEENAKKVYGDGPVSIELGAENAKRMKTIAKRAGIIGNVVTASDIVHGFVKDNGTIGQNTQQAIAGAIGGMAGAYAGAKIFGTAGLFLFGPVGGFVGGVVGAIIGGYYGSQLGESIVEGYYQ